MLCSPGCFSIYRARAVQDVLPTYASHVECAMDFLTKDMGKTVCIFVCYHATLLLIRIPLRLLMMKHYSSAEA